jgi:hypothetical protein
MADDIVQRDRKGGKARYCVVMWHITYRIFSIVVLGLREKAEV